MDAGGFEAGLVSLQLLSAFFCRCLAFVLHCLGMYGLGTGSLRDEGEYSSVKTESSPALAP